MANEEPKANPWSTIGQVVVVGFAALLVYSFVTVAKEGELRRRCTPTCMLKPEYAGVDRIVPDFTLKNMKGESVSMSAYRGKVVILNFWTKTCGPCLEEMPDLAELARVLAPRSDVAILTISTDDGPDDVLPTLKSVLKEAPPFPVLFDPDFKVVKERFGTSLYPETWIIDARGVVRARFDGPRDWTMGAVVELVDQIRGGGYCPIEIQNGKRLGIGAAMCEKLSGG